MTIQELIDRLQKAQIYFTMSSSRVGESVVMFHCAVPGQRWEVEVFPDGHVETEVFVQDDKGVWEDDARLIALIEEWSEPQA